MLQRATEAIVGKCGEIQSATLHLRSLQGGRLSACCLCRRHVQAGSATLTLRLLPVQAVYSIGSQRLPCGAGCYTLHLRICVHS
jgi:hypothetical protein